MNLLLRLSSAVLLLSSTGLKVDGFIARSTSPLSPPSLDSGLLQSPGTLSSKERTCRISSEFYKLAASESDAATDLPQASLRSRIRTMAFISSPLWLLCAGRRPAHALSLSSPSGTIKNLLQHRRATQVITAALIGAAMQVLSKQHRVHKRQATDATSEWERYARNPGARGRALMWLLTRVMARHVVAKLRRRERREQFETKTGQVLAQGLLQLGPLYIKMGQIISSRPDSLPSPTWLPALESLQDQVPAKSGDEAWKLVDQVWPGGLSAFNETFCQFDATPLAAASLGQVHRARLLLPDGDPNGSMDVALKLQRPFLRQIYDQDFAFLTKIARSVDRVRGWMAKSKKSSGGGIQQSWTDIFADAREILYREIDYRDEAENGLRFCNDFGIDSSCKSVSTSLDGEPLPSAESWVRAPRVFSDLSSESCLVMEFVPSMKSTDAKTLREAGLTQSDGEYLADCLARAYLRMFCCHRFFSTDPHAGNVGVEVLDPDATSPDQRFRLVFYDFGQAATLTEGQAEGILQVLESIVDMDADQAVAAFERMGVLDEAADLQKVRQKVAHNFATGKVKANRKRLSKRGYQFGSSKNVETEATNETVAPTKTSDAEIMGYFSLPASYAFVARALTQLHGVGQSLDAEFDFVSSSAPYLYEIKGAKAYLSGEASKWVGRNVPPWLRDVLPTYSADDESDALDY